MSNKIKGAKRYCQIQIAMLKERQKRLEIEIFDGQMQIEYLEGLINEIEGIKSYEEPPSLAVKKVYLAPPLDRGKDD